MKKNILIAIITLTSIVGSAQTISSYDSVVFKGCGTLKNVDTFRLEIKSDTAILDIKYVYSDTILDVAFTDTVELHDTFICHKDESHKYTYTTYTNSNKYKVVVAPNYICFDYPYKHIYFIIK